jgi:asparagine synthase (glutamine-hydrolysing)
MCGFAFVSSSTAISESLKIDLINRISHRGPDDSQLLDLDEFSTILFTRLAIRDIKNGGQPFIQTEQGFISCLNGELYNEEEIRVEIQKSFPDRTSIPSGDMQLLAMYIHLFGPESLNKVDGMFAGFVLNIRSREIVVVRDRFGEKPVYYYLKDKTMIICSEVPLLEISKTNEFQKDFVRRGFSLDSSLPLTEFKELPKASFLRMSGGSEILELEKYWHWPTRSSNYLASRNANFSEVDEILETAIFESTRRRLASDVPVALLLSGGVDSTLLASIINDLTSGDMTAFTLSMNNSNYDESQKALRISNYLGIRHEIVSYSDKELANLSEELIHKMDIPILDPACLSMYALSKAVSKNFKVAISGDGGDELFMGYKLFSHLKLLHKFSTISSIVSFMTLITGKVLPESTSTYIGLATQTHRLRDAVDRDFKVMLENSLSPLAGTIAFKIITSEKGFKTRLVPKHTLKDGIEFLEHYYQDLVLPKLFLVKSDRMSMLNGVEVRSPLLNSEVAEVASRYSIDYLLKNPKGPLVNLLVKKYPKNILSLNKHGFSPPFQQIRHHLDEPKWKLNRIGISSSAANQIWRTKGQNAAIASWALFVINSFIYRNSE